MEAREDLLSILPHLPLISRSSALFWPPPVVAALKDLCKGPDVSNVNSGRLFAVAIADMRDPLRLPRLHNSVSLGFSLFFDELMNRDKAEKWFRDVIPNLSGLLLRLPTLLETHYQSTDASKMKAGLRLLNSQQPGLVLLSQELIAALLACALFCLFPSANRDALRLQPINFDGLFRLLYESFDSILEHKIKCIVHYFEKISMDMPRGYVSYERKVLPWKGKESEVAYPEAGFWGNSTASLSYMEVISSGLIEDHPMEALEVDFANKYIGGGALGRGCVQEEIRFMINPELIVSLLFLPAMEDNEAIEIVGAERFSSYSGYASSFQFTGDHSDTKSMDTMGRRRTRIVAIDALCFPGQRQYKVECLLRETNKAFCGFLNHSLDKKDHHMPARPDQAEDASTSMQGESRGFEGKIGIATGNWGCGAFGGDPQVKAMIQWLAASEAQRPFILYYTFGLKNLEKLGAVVEWILDHQWSVGDLWNMLVEYGYQRFQGQTSDRLFKWLIPSLQFISDNELSSCRVI